MTHVYDGLCWESEEEVVYYRRTTFWLTCTKAVSVQHNAIFLTRLVSHYMEQLKHAPKIATSSLETKAPINSTNPNNVATVTTIIGASSLGGANDSSKIARETENETRKVNESTGLVNEIAAFMVHGPETATVVPPMETVSDVTTYLLKKLCDTEAKMELFYWNVVQGRVDDSKVTIMEREAMKNFCKFLCNSLNELITASKASVEAFYDFDYVWKLVVRTPQVREALEQLLPMKSAEDSISQAKIIAWKVGCLYHLSSQSQSLSSGNKISQTKRQGRRHRLLVTAASIGLLCKLPSLNGTGTNSSDGGESPVAVTPQQSQQMDESEDANQIADAEDSPMGQGAKGGGAREEKAPQVEEEHKHPKPPSKEEEAIAALKMMLDNPPPSSEVKPSLHHEVSTNDLVIIVLESVNTLKSQFSIINLFDQDIGSELTQEDVENEVVEQARQLVSILRSPTVSFAVDPSTEKHDGLAKLPPLAVRLKALLSSSSDMHNLVAVAKIDDAILARLNDPIVAGIKVRKQPPSLRPVFRFIDEFRLITEGERVVSKIFYKATNCVETKTAFKRPAIFCIECTDDVRITQETQNQVANAIAKLTSAGEHVQRTIAATEQMKLNEWCLTLFSTMVAKPGSRLSLYFHSSDDEVRKQRVKLTGEEEMVGTVGWRNVVVPILNSVVFKLTEENKECEAQDPMMVSSETGQAQLYDLKDPDKRICVALIVLYYHSLETLLFHETARLKTAAHPSLVQSESFHRAVLSCCYLCIVKGFGESKQLDFTGGRSEVDVMRAIEMMESTPYSFLRVSESFSRAMQLEHASNAHSFYRVNNSFNRGVGKEPPKPQSTVIPGLPVILLKHLSYSESLLLDSFIWKREFDVLGEGSVMKGIAELQDLPRFAPTLSWPPHVLHLTLSEEKKDYGQDAQDVSPLIVASQRKYSSPSQRYAVYIVRRLLPLMNSRISVLCAGLDIEEEETLLVASQTWIAFRYMMRHHIELLRDRHVDQLLLCCLYGVCKMLTIEPVLTFSRLIDVYTEVRGEDMGEDTCSRVVRHVRIRDVPAKGESIIDLYNLAFIPVMKNHLLKSQSLRRAANWIRASVGDVGDGSNLLENRSFEPVQAGNVTVQVRCGTKRPNFMAKAQEKVSRVRVIYSFGDPVRNDLDLANKFLSN